jgi:DNA-binding response OmpR family regulator
MGTVVLVQFDEDAYAEVPTALRADGHRVHAVDRSRAAESIRAHSPDLVILAPTRSGADSFEVCRVVRSISQTPILVLAAGDDEVDELMAFASGADDYLPVSKSIRLLRARVGALLRRSEPPEVSGLHAVGDLVVDTEMRRVTVGGAHLHLTRIEFELLVALLENRHRVVPRSELIARIWGPWPGDDHVVEVHLSRMRNKILAAGGPRLGEPSPGFGYRLGGPTARAV